MNEWLKAIRFLFKSVVGTAHATVILLFVASAFSDRISPERSVLFAYLGLGFPVFCLLNLCFIIYWLFIREWRFALIGLASVLICWGPVARYFPLHGKSRQIPKENVLKILTYNVMGFGYKNHTKDSPNPILQYIARSDADIVCLQEYAVGTSGKFLTDRKIAQALNMYRYRSVVPIGTSGALTFSIAVFSKYPITRSRKIRYESTFNGSSVHELNIKGKKLTLINNHLESFKLTTEDKGRYRSFITHLNDIKNINAGTLDDLKSSIHQKLGPAFRIRARQARAVAGEIRKADTDYVIVCGDFNDTPVSYAHRTIQGTLTDAYAASGCGIGVTYNENFFWFRIDNILYSSHMKALNCTVDKIRYSDHYPVWCYLQLKE